LGLARELLCNFTRCSSLRGTIGTVKILAIDTSSTHGGVAYLVENRVLSEESGELSEPSSSGLFRRVSTVLGRASAKLSDVECFAVAVGPGSFTGVRVGLAAVKGWAEVWQRPVAGVSVLEAVAAEATEPGNLVIAVTNARRGLLFSGLYERISIDRASVAASDRVVDGIAGLRKLGDESVGTPAEILERLAGASGESPLFATPSPEAAVGIVSSLAGRSTRIEMVPASLAPAIGLLGLRQSQRGQLLDALTLNANYIQRSAAEVNWREPV
jgi:tRNA threonylcarbamoyladenosine biosynthesis protein TsaB